MPTKKAPTPTKVTTRSTTAIIDNLYDLTTMLRDLRSTAGSPLWYRGCKSATSPLLPSLYRHPTITDIARLVELEKKMIQRFRQRSVPYQNRELKDNWEYLFFMQHFGVPTRLLDWTENPYIALYFALSHAPDRYDTGAPVYADDSVLWVLNPNAWNKKSLEDLGSTGEILSPPDDAALSGYGPMSPTGVIQTLPVAIYGTYNSYRIAARRGVFTIFGKSLIPMEDHYANLKFPKDTLAKLTIPRTRIPELMSSLMDLGVTDTTAFPDLDGLAKETKRHFGFTV